MSEENVLGRDHKNNYCSVIKKSCDVFTLLLKTIKKRKVKERKLNTHLSWSHTHSGCFLTQVTSQWPNLLCRWAVVRATKNNLMNVWDYKPPPIMLLKQDVVSSWRLLNVPPPSVSSQHLLAKRLSRWLSDAASVCRRKIKKTEKQRKMLCLNLPAKKSRRIIHTFIIMLNNDNNL